MTAQSNITDIRFSRLTVGDNDPLAAGRAQLGLAQSIPFRLNWKGGQSIRAELLPGDIKLPDMTCREYADIERELKTAYQRIVFTYLYGEINPDNRRTLSANVKTLRLGLGLTTSEAAKRLGVRTETLLQCEDGIFDLEADLQKYITPSDALLFRMAQAYRVSDDGAWSLWSPHFFLVRYVRDFCYDLGANPIQKRMRPNFGRIFVDYGRTNQKDLEATIST